MSTVPSGPPIPKIQRILPRHHKIIELALAGHDYKSIAMSLEMAPGSVALVLKDPFVQNELARRRAASEEITILDVDRRVTMDKAQSMLEAATTRAAQTQISLLDSSNPSVALKASESILDRALGSDKNRAPVINITIEQANLLKLALQESENGRKPSANRSTPQDPQAGGSEVSVRQLEDGDGSSAQSSSNEPSDVCEVPDVGP